MEFVTQVAFGEGGWLSRGWAGHKVDHVALVQKQRVGWWVWAVDRWSHFAKSLIFETPISLRVSGPSQERMTLEVPFELDFPKLKI